MDDEYPEMTCPKCGKEYPDMDGFGLMHCPACGYCTHAAITNGICGLCGRRPEQRNGEPTE